jgi:Skp family chaperone for outer membrane proteins
MQSTALTAAKPAAAQNLPPALRDRIAHLHADYQKQFTADAQATIDDFQKTRLDLSRRYAALGGADAAAGGDARDQIASLQRKRDELYDQMVEQIKREATTMAHERGLSVVVSNPVAEIRGVDLTDDVAKDVETLHE